ncbi:MAG: hypothetical protein V2J12_06045 [Gammaproteobacteria bacterium]|jgi:hypothetical protein|nr:hypothetical protein [Gammaproteobacteria bacterium]
MDMLSELYTLKMFTSRPATRQEKIMNKNQSDKSDKSKDPSKTAHGQAQPERTGQAEKSGDKRDAKKNS